MFDSFIVINKCNLFLNKYNMSISNDFHIFRKYGLIHCQIMDWRGPVEIDGFPVITVDSAVDKLIVSTVNEYYINQETKIREELKSNYPLGYGEYDARKYFFEKTLKIIKEYNENLYRKQISIFTKYINQNRSAKFKWKFNVETHSFETIRVLDGLAVNINKYNSTILVYSCDPNGGRPLDNFYKYLNTRKM